MFTKDEYKGLIDSFTKDVKSNLSNEIESLLLVGSVAVGEHIAGESDCDFLLILKTDAAKENAMYETMNKVSQILHTYLEDPLYSALIDVDVISAEDIPKGDKEDFYPWTKVVMAKNGKALIGENPFALIEVTDEQLKEAAKEMARYFYSQMKEIVIFPQEDDYQQTYMMVEAVLGLACAYLYYNGERDFYRSNAILLFEEKYKDKIDIEPVQLSHRLRLAAKSVDTSNFIEKSVNFGKQVIDQIFK